jgi:hypothetical protein
MTLKREATSVSCRLPLLLAFLKVASPVWVLGAESNQPPLFIQTFRFGLDRPNPTQLVDSIRERILLTNFENSFTLEVGRFFAAANRRN